MTQVAKDVEVFHRQGMMLGALQHRAVTSFTFELTQRMIFLRKNLCCCSEMLKGPPAYPAQSVRIVEEQELGRRFNHCRGTVLFRGTIVGTENVRDRWLARVSKKIFFHPSPRTI